MDDKEQDIVTNRLFWGAEDICENMFGGNIRPDLLRRMITYCGFPAPRMPKGKGKVRVTTWGLLESWLIMLYDNEMCEDKADMDRSIRKLWNRKASNRLRNMYINGMSDEEAKELVEAAERWSKDTEEGRWQKAIRVHRNARWRFQQKYGFDRSTPPRREEFRIISIEFPPAVEKS